MGGSDRDYRGLFEESRDGIFFATPRGRLIDINRAGVRLLGCDSKEEALALASAKVFFQNPDDRHAVIERLEREGSIEGMEVALRRRDGRSLIAVLTASPVRDEEGAITSFRGFIKDVTEQRALELQLSRAQKMEAVGRLAGGVAHDFNNLLSVIVGYGELLRSTHDGSPVAREYVEEILEAADRGANLTRQLLAFGRRQSLAPERLNLNRIVLDMDRLLRRLIGEDIELTTKLDAELGPIVADRGQIEQVVLNLAVNARDAMPHGGRLTLETSMVRRDELLVSAQAAQATHEEYVKFSVSDTGSGIPPEIMEHIFEPFFSTKEPGEGTGLGLATVYGVVQQSDGHIEVASAADQGCRFEIYLPRAPEVQEADRPETVSSHRPGGHERVLIVEDDSALQTLLVRMLQRLGYDVIAASNGEEALNVAKTLEDLDLLLTDIVMPRMNGLDLARRLRGRRERLKVLFISGYSDSLEEPDAAGELDHPLHFLQKPFTSEALAQRIRQILD